MAITQLPDPPSRSDPSTFAEKGDAFLGALQQFVIEANALLAQCEARSTTLLTLQEIREDLAPSIAGKVSMSGAETIAGVKTFSSSPIIPNAAVAQQPLTYGQVAAANAEVVKTALNASGNAPIFASRAFCNFDGSGTASIRRAGNIAGITDRGTGKYTFAFVTTMPGNTYAVVEGVGNDSDTGAGGSLNGWAHNYQLGSFEYTVSNNDTDSLSDPVCGNLAIFY